MRTNKTLLILAFLLGLISIDIIEPKKSPLLNINQPIVKLENNFKVFPNSYIDIQNYYLIQEDSQPDSVIFNKVPTFDYTTPSQAAVDSVIREDFETLERTGSGLYVGRPGGCIKGIPQELEKGRKSIDCYDALRIVLEAEIPERAKKILSLSKDANGNFSTPFLIDYLVTNEGWEAYSFYDEKKYSNLENKTINDRDVKIIKGKSGRHYYRSGDVEFPLTNILLRKDAEPLLKELTLERGYALGFQRDGTHCYSLIQRGMFEVHLNSYPLGYELYSLVTLRPLDLHEGRYCAFSSIGVFAFPPEKEANIKQVRKL